MIECSRVKTGAVRMQDARIRIIREWPNLPEIRVCRFDDCPDKPCIESCPIEAITMTEGIVRIDRDACTGCRVCTEACPWDAIWMDEDDLAFKCDFCGGDPACVKECVTKAISKGGADDIQHV